VGSFNDLLSTFNFVYNFLPCHAVPPKLETARDEKWVGDVDYRYIFFEKPAKASPDYHPEKQYPLNL
jgi:hypothetical protein